MEKKPEKVIELAVKGMLPKGPLGRSDVHRSFMFMLVQIMQQAGSEARSINSFNIRTHIRRILTVAKKANGKFYGTGRRKSSQLLEYILVPGTGNITINKRDTR